MRVAKLGSYLAVRLPADLVAELGLKAGDEIDLVKDDETVHVRRQPRADEIFKAPKRFQGKLPSETRLCLDAVHER